MSEENWIAEREKIALFRPDGVENSDAKSLLEISPTNRDLTVNQGRLFTISRVLAQVTGIDIYYELPNELEKVQANIEDTARHDYMKVAIEQFQGKLANSKTKAAIEAAL